MKNLMLILMAISLFAMVSCGGDSKDVAPETEPTTEAVVEDTEKVEETPAVEETTEETVAEETTQISESPAKESAPATEQKSSWTGNVVNLNAVAIGGDASLTAERAEDLTKRGQLLGFMANNQVYFVYNQDGTYASKKLAKSAGSQVKISGTAKKMNGINILIAESYE